jgi:hypothetical protein
LQILFFDNIEYSKSGGTGHRIAAKRIEIPAAAAKIINKIATCDDADRDNYQAFVTIIPVPPVHALAILNASSFASLPVQQNIAVSSSSGNFPLRRSA